MMMTNMKRYVNHIKKLWYGAELNRRHQDFQSCALPTELPYLPVKTPLLSGTKIALFFKEVLFPPKIITNILKIKPV